MSYSISKYSFNKAKNLGVEIKPSTRKNKKIDVFNKEGKKLASIGDVRYKDYSMYIKEKGLKFAKERRALYHLRHAKTKNKIGSPSYYSARILW